MVYAIDDLLYEYDTGNKLINVMDLTNFSEGFNDGNQKGVNGNTDNDFEYDTYGNLIKDRNKEIDEIVYNHLNLPKKIIFENENTIEYLYDANGVKLKKTVTDNTTNPIAVTTTHYLDGFQYIDDKLEFFPTAEGYVKATHTSSGGLGGGTTSYNYVFNYTDHLGNIRLRYALNEDNWMVILEEDHYYPFGLKHKGYNAENYVFASIGDGPVQLIPTNPNALETYKYKYNGMEYQSELGLSYYDFGARNYDPALGRWMNIDPLAEVSRRWSPYTYAYNNPVYFIDPDGMMAFASMAPPDIYINEQGEFLGTDGAKSKDVRVVSQSTWDSVGGQEGALTAEGTATLQKSENSSLLSGTSKEQPGYQKGISISDATKEKIAAEGGTIGDPYLVNNSESSAFIRPEENVTQGPGATNQNGDYTPQEVKPGESVYGMVDGVKTSKFRDAVFKLVDGNKVSIGSGGNVSVTTYGGLYGFGGAMTIGGWSTTEFPELRSVPIGNSNLNKSPTSLSGFKRFGEY